MHNYIRIIGLCGDDCDYQSLLQQQGDLINEHHNDNDNFDNFEDDHDNRYDKCDYQRYEG